MRTLVALCALLWLAGSAKAAPQVWHREAPPAPQVWGKEVLQPVSVSPHLAGQGRSTGSDTNNPPPKPGGPLCPRLTDTREQAYRAALPLYQDAPAVPLAVQSVETRAFPDCRMTRLSYTGGHGQRVPALLFMPLTASRTNPAPALMLLPGLGTGKEVLAGTARWLASKGYASLAIDLATQGERAPVHPSATVSASQLEEQLKDGIPQSVLDTRRGVDLLQGRPNINPHRLGLIGVSLGALVGTVTAGTDTRLRATILIAGGGDWRVILQALSRKGATLGGRAVTGRDNINWDGLNARLAFCDPATFAPHIAPRALLMENGALDATIAPEAADILYNAARAAPGSRVHRDVFPHAGHIPPPEMLYANVAPWLASHL